MQQEPERSEVLIDLGHTALIKFDECRLGQVVVKSTTLSTDLPLHHWRSPQRESSTPVTSAGTQSR